MLSSQSLTHQEVGWSDFNSRIDELLQRNVKLRKVNDLISLDKLRGFLATIHYRRAFLEWREEKRRAEANGRSAAL